MNRWPRILANYKALSLLFSHCKAVALCILLGCLVRTLRDGMIADAGRDKFAEEGEPIETRCLPIAHRVPHQCHRFEQRNITFDCEKTISQEKCGNVPHDELTVCHRVSMKKETYNCTVTEEVPDCNQITREVESMCYETVHVNTSYPCPIYNEPLHDCTYEEENEDAAAEGHPPDYFPYTSFPRRLKRNKHGKHIESEISNWNTADPQITPSIGKETMDMQDAIAHVPSSCTEEVETTQQICNKLQVVSVPYSCNETVYQTVCTEIPREVDKVCYKTVLREYYDCPVFKYKTVCDFSARVSPGRLPRSTAYPDPAIATTFVDLPSREIQFATNGPSHEDPVYYREEAVAPSASHVRTCIGKECGKAGKEKKKRRLGKGLKDKGPVGSPPLFKNPNEPKGACYGYDCNIRVPEPICKKVPYKEPKKCERGAHQQAYPCKGEEITSECAKRPITKHKTCERKEVRMTEYPCKKKTHRDCSSQPSLKSAAVAATPRIAKAKATKADSSVIETMETIKRKHSLGAPTRCSSQKRSRVSKQILQEEPEVCYKMMPLKKPYKCIQGVIDQVCTPKIQETYEECSRMVPFREEYSCSKTQWRFECKTHNETILSTCTEQRLVPVIYPCYQDTFAKECWSNFIPAPQPIIDQSPRHFRSKVKQ